MSRQQVVCVLISDRRRISNCLIVASIDLYFVETKLFLAYVDTMFGTNAARGEDPLRWLGLKGNHKRGTKEREKRFGIQAQL